MTKNACHSLNRFSCYKQDQSLLTQSKSDNFKTVSAHLYYNAVDCAKAVLAGAFVQYSVVALFAVVALLF